MTVRYDPADPAPACLSCGINGSIRVLLMFAAAWYGFILGFIIMAWVGIGPDRVLLDHLRIAPRVVGASETGRGL